MVRLPLILTTCFALATVSASRRPGPPGQGPVHLPTDWSHRHLVFSVPHSIEQAVRFQNEPRYWHQWFRHHPRTAEGANPEVTGRERDSRESDDRDRSRHNPPASTTSLHPDWGETQNVAAGVPGTVGLGMFPAKFSFDVNAAPDCTNDFVVFNTSLLGVSPTTAATQTTANSFATTGTPVGTFVINDTKDDTETLTLTAAADNTGNDFLVGTSGAANAASLAARIQALGAAYDVTATASGANVTVTAAAKGNSGNNITLSKTLTNFTLGSPTLTGGVGSGNIMALNNLYSSQDGTGSPFCSGLGPNDYWSYYTGGASPGSAVTSVVLSADGTKVAFVENVGTNAVLRILQWKAGEGSDVGYPVAPTLTLAAATSWASGCPSVASGGSSCLSSITFNGTGAVDTKSSPFYDYNTDTIYVGENDGDMHKFTGVFNGTPAEVTTSWPITVDSGLILTSPVYDSGSGNIFVGDSNGDLSFIQEVGSTVGGATPCSPLPCLNSVHLNVGTTPVAPGIVDGPILDGTTGMVFVVNGNESNHGTIVQANTALGSPVSFSIAGGTTTTVQSLYSGAFDHAYLTSAKPTIAGHMYVCGQNSARNASPYVYQLSFNSSGVLTGVGTSTFSAGTGWTSASTEACSPVTEFYNPNGGGAGVPKDWIFFSVGSLANTAGTSNPLLGTPCQTGTHTNIGCVISVDVTTATTWPVALPTTLVHAASLPANIAGASSGIIVDNTSTSTQASSFYFTLGAVSTGTGPGVPSCNITAGIGCAVKLTQAALQ